MDADRFDALVAALRDALTTAPSRRAALRAIGGLGLAGLVGQTDAKKKKKKKKCAKAGQATSKKRKKCCAGLAQMRTASVSAPRRPAAGRLHARDLSANACGDLPDGCGGTLDCGGCTGNRSVPGGSARSAPSSASAAPRSAGPS